VLQTAKSCQNKRNGYVTNHGSPRELVKQLSVIYPCGKGQISEAGRVAAGKVILGLFTPSYGRFCFTKWRGEP